MTIRPEVARVCGFAPLPPEDRCTAEFLDAFAAAVEALPSPVTTEEADALLDVLATPDDSGYFGLMLGVRGAIESAPQLPASLWHRGGPWIAELQELARASGIEAPGAG